jgi:PHD/YefM family antitoxin component YafN of YafNO toxin-antitoxin module
MLRATSIYSLSEFRQKSKDFIDEMKASGAPLILTVNGKAELIVCEANAFQNLLDRLERAETEVATLRSTVGTTPKP